jgi:hypothetical protein
MTKQDITKATEGLVLKAKAAAIRKDIAALRSCVEGLCDLIGEARATGSRKLVKAITAEFYAVCGLETFTIDGLRTF